MKKKLILKRACAIALSFTFFLSALGWASKTAYGEVTVENTSATVTMNTIDSLTSDKSMAVKLQNLAIEQLLQDYYSLDKQIETLQSQISRETDPIILASLSAKMTAALASKDAKWEAYSDARENISDVITPQIANIKVLYLTYSNCSLTEQKTKLSLEKAKNDLTLAEKKFNLHYISQTQLDTFQDTYDKLVNGQDSVVAARKNAMEKLLNALGLNADSTVVLPELFDLSDVSKLDYVTSLQSALTKNKSIKDAQDDLNDARNLAVPYYDEDIYQVKVAKTKLTSLQNARTEAFTQAFDGMKNAYDNYKKSDVVLQRDIKKASQMESKLKLGYVSKNQYDDFMRNLEIEKLQQKMDNFSLYAQFVSVQNYIKGY